jgi:hypothetical protein
MYQVPVATVSVESDPICVVLLNSCSFPPVVSRIEQSAVVLERNCASCTAEAGSAST